MEIIKHDTAKEINYFKLSDFVDNIKLTSRVLDHMQETNMNFDEYFSKLSKYNDDVLLYFWISLAYEDFKNNNYVENHTLSKFDFSIRNLFMDELEISHDRIHNVHNFVMKEDATPVEDVEKYRNTEVRVSAIGEDYEEIFWYGAQAKDIERFMDDFIEIYKSKTMSVIDSNPFLKSALIHLLFVKIHPYSDGNGRTARILNNIKFTEGFNKLYNMNLQISPINLSQSINLNRITYVRTIDNIYFDLDHDNNEMINYWFNFILNMYDEQLFKNSNMINDMENVMERIEKVKDRMNPKVINQLDKKRIRTK